MPDSQSVTSHVERITQLGTPYVQAFAEGFRNEKRTWERIRVFVSESTRDLPEPPRISVLDSVNAWFELAIDDARAKRPPARGRGKPSRPGWVADLAKDAVTRAEEHLKALESYRDECLATGLGWQPGVGPRAHVRPDRFRPAGITNEVGERYAIALGWHRTLFDAYDIRSPATLRELTREPRRSAPARRVRNRYSKFISPQG